MNTDDYERHTKGPWEWYEFADGDWILCPLWEDVIATDDWYVDAKTGEHIESHDAIWNWDDAILSLQSNCLTGNDMRCVSSTHRFGKNYTDQRLIAAAPELFADNKRLREENSILKNTLRRLLKDNSAEVWFQANKILQGDEE